VEAVKAVESDRGGGRASQRKAIPQKDIFEKQRRNGGWVRLGNPQQNSLAPNAK